jgi:uncharacterized protein YndB with AHSA1/START domain
VGPIDPLRYSFRVECPPEDAFRLWTAQAGVWWPMTTHSVSGQDGARLVIEPHSGGRIFERLPDGREFEWGKVAVFDPPGLLVCEWLIGDTPTELEVRFEGETDGATLVELEHRGWERFGDEGPERRETNRGGWDGVLALFVVHCGDSPV